MLSGAIDTGGDPGVTFTASPAAPYSFGGLTITSSAILNGIPVGLGFYSTALFEADPLSDYVASGNQPGAETVTAQTVEVPTSTGLSSVNAEIGAYPAASGFGHAAHPGHQVRLLDRPAGGRDPAGDDGQRVQRRAISPTGRPALARSPRTDSGARRTSPARTTTPPGRRAPAASPGTRMTRPRSRAR